MPCDEGTYSNATNLTDKSQCLPCPHGTSCTAASVAAGPCAPGAYAAVSRSSHCTLCAVGSFQSDVGATACVHCSAGSFCPVGSTQELLANCAPGTYANATDTDGLTDCFECEPGYSCAGGAAPPVGCSPGSFTNVSLSVECNACEGGSYQPERNATGCERCPTGRVCPPRSSSAAPCPGGTHQNPVVLVMSSFDECIACPPSTWCSIGSANATACSPGTYNPLARQEACFSCEPGKFQSDEGATACRECQAGFVCQKGASASVPCPAGTHQPPHLTVMTSLEQCIDCFAGTYCGLGSNEPTPCSIGTFNPRTREDRCTECPVGTTTASVGTVSLAGCVCKVDQYDRDPEANVTDCVDCPFISSECKSAGAGVTLESLPLAEGYWRAYNRSQYLRQCYNPDFCEGGNSCTGGNLCDGYCTEHHSGPYCERKWSDT